jgi:hypothetical protein
MGEWIEIRASEKRPIRHTSKFTKEGYRIIREPVITTEPYYRVDWHDKPEKFTYTVKNVVYHGGKVLCSMKRDRFVMRWYEVMTLDTRPKLPTLTVNGMIELPPLIAEAFLDAKWRRIHGC